MKRFFGTLKFLGKAIFLVLLLLVGWAYINVTNLVKGRKPHDEGKNFRTNPFDPSIAHADVPIPPDISCPHVALWNGKKFCVENDFLLGKPGSFARDQVEIRSRYENNLIGPDLLKFSSPILKSGGKITLQLQEIEEEETFVDTLHLIRVVHPADSEVIPNVDFRKYHIVASGKLGKNSHMPVRVVKNGGEDITARFRNIHFPLGSPRVADDEDTFNFQDSVEFTFAGLKTDEDPLVIIQSCFRDWVAGPEPTSSAPLLFSFFNTRALTRTAALFGGALYLALASKHAAGVFALAPMIIGTQTTSKSIKFSYTDAADGEHIVAIHGPRDWRYATEAISFPRDAVRSDGSMALRAKFTKRHALRFVGIAQGEKEIGRREEVLGAASATHSREGDLGDVLTRKDSKYAHMIPGDTIDVTFENPCLQANNQEQETYLMRSSGFYTALSAQYEKIAGDWQSGLSAEAQEHYKKLTPLRS